MSEVKLHKLAKDWTGVRIGRAVVQKLDSKEGHYYIWEALCDCGNTCKIKARELSAGDTKSCGCLKKESDSASGARLRTHGLSKTFEYRAWKRIKSRCTNPNNQDYPVYSKLGMEEVFKTDYLSFLAEIGESPKDGKRWSVGRIDNTKGYFKENIRWEHDAEQSKNKGMYSNNNTGFNGVNFYSQKGDRSYYVATWYTLTKKQKSKYFSINKLGDELAFFMACTYREHQIDLLNLQGAGYSKDHGKAGYNAKGGSAQ